MVGNLIVKSEKKEKDLHLSDYVALRMISKLK